MNLWFHFKKDGRIDGCRDGKFRYLGDRPSRWLDEPDVRLYGYWFWDGYEEYQKVDSIDPDARTFTLSPPYSNRYPELARLKENEDVNLISRKTFFPIARVSIFATAEYSRERSIRQRADPSGLKAS